MDKEKEMNLTYVSNSAVTPQEFSEFHSRMENHDTALPSRGFLEKKVRDMERATNYRMNDEDITRMVELKKKYAPRPVNVAMRKAELSKLKNAAVLNQDVEEAARLQEEIDELTSHSRQQDAPRFESQAKIHQINQRNNSLTMKALGDAMNSQQRVQSERGTDDPFTRRWGTPTMVHKKGGIAAAVLQIPGEKGAGGEVNGVHGQHSVPATGPVESATGVKADPFNMHNFELGRAFFSAMSNDGSYY